MHEWALAEGVVTTALEAARQHRTQRIDRLVVKIGQLQQIERELFATALDAVRRDSPGPLDDAEFVLQIEAARFHCRACSADFPYEEAVGSLSHEEAEAIHFVPELAHGYACCPACQSPDFEVVQGRGVWLDAIEGA
ncbi:MAG: hydrogenase nickel incorporation protein HypA [Candidatus Latescibacteria bacterium]|nr:hydrogenase nickel incorporation protein HypA [Candidatus Latescibacterota bacterium]